MAKIYQFPQGEERAKFRKEIAGERKKRFCSENREHFLLSGLAGDGFYLRLLVASVFTFLSLFFCVSHSWCV
nr:hypothetical protein MJEJOPCA_00041 [Escherichia sp.]